ncbi:YcnI family copper-binding membrane protein [Nocardia stercoris]|uniref:DUF1775 domain-containing protein n=1 Tax=Nocardia stercoris TaxID=2483361 RepID=A0A3M2KVZ2_9NOCA|nr:YcnI family protein [Nocardia stercoris]RMI27665.1 DUF1775 domain-containing protein [Nocardia stercoris]
MPPIRRLLTITLAAAAVAAATAGTAAAHVEVSAPDATRGGNAVLTFRVPNESATNSPTVALTVQFPALTAVDYQPIPGWKATTSTDKNGNVTAVTWTADPGVGIFPGQFGQFQVLADNLPDQDTVTFPATQTYSDGEVVTWSQPPNKNGSEPELPVPTLTLAPKHSDKAEPTGRDSTDRTARWLGGIGIGAAASALGATAGLLFRSRERARQGSRRGMN